MPKPPLSARTVDAIEAELRALGRPGTAGDLLRASYLGDGYSLNTIQYGLRLLARAGRVTFTGPDGKRRYRPVERRAA